MKKNHHTFLQKGFPPQWSQMDPKTLREDALEGIRRAQKAIDKICAFTENEITYESCIRAFDRATTDLDNLWNWANHLDAVSNSPELREAIAETLPEVTEFYSSIHLNGKLWKIVKKFSESDEAKRLEGYKKTLLEDTLEDFKSSGADLPADKKQRLMRIGTLLAQKTQKFSDNVLDATNAYFKHVEDEAMLAGLPASAMALARKKAEEKKLAGWVFTLEAPSFNPVLTYAKSDALREEMWRASSKVGREAPFDNGALIAEILALRDEEASLLGHKNFADFVLKRRMAKSGKNALNFVFEIRAKISERFRAETGELELFKAELENSDEARLAPWQVPYYAQLMRKARHDFDPEVLRDYFSFENVMDGLFKICKTLFGLSVNKAATPDVWHEGVEFYEVRNERGKHIGSFYADFFPRKEKRAGAWMNLLKSAKGISPALGFIGGNFNEPAGGKPALLSHDEVSTLFHEFGHLIHFFLMDCPEFGLRDVAWDFVELPSQIMENWCAKKECLDIFSFHYRTAEKIPAKVFDAFEKSRKFRGASDCMRQLLLSASDLMLHLDTKNFSSSLDEKLDALLEDYKTPLSENPPNILARFTHIFGDPVGYAAGYYSYKWAEVLDADAFSRFEREGVLNPKVGREFADKILRVGKTVEPDEAFENFMGRPPNIDALIKRMI